MQANKRRDAIILTIVAIVGIGGLLLLQIARNNQALTSDERTVVQNETEADKKKQGQQSAIQAVSANLLHINDQPEIDVPFHYELTDFSPGGVYQLDPGDGAPRQNFVNGKLSYTYHKPGSFIITIYAIDGANEYKILSVPKEVANLTEQKVLNKKTKKPGFDD